MPTYVAGDVRGIQEYIFGSPRLLEMRGGSALIDFFDHAVVPAFAQHFRGEAIFSGGGNFLLVFDALENGQLATLSEGLVNTFFDLTAGPALALVTHTSDLPFPQVYRELGRQLRQAKRMPSGTEQLVSMPFLKRCESCGRETADRAFRQPPPAAAEERQWLGPACIRKHEMHAAIRQAAQQGKTARQPFFAPWSVDEVWAMVPSFTALRQGTGTAPKDFWELVGEDDLAILVADGNDLGSWFEDLDVVAFKETSLRIDKGMQQAVDQAAAALAQTGEDLGLQVLICGGDDLVVALPARRALRFARVLFDYFVVEHPDDGRLAGLAAGLVISNPGFPFLQGYGLAKGLLARAKARCRDDSLPSTIDFLRLTSSHAPSLSGLLDAVEGHDGGENGWAFGVAGPYSLPELDELLILGERLAKEVTASQRGRLREVLSPCQSEETLNEHWKVPARVVDQLLTWWRRQAASGKAPPFDEPLASKAPPAGFLKAERRKLADGRQRTYQRFVLADALLLAAHGGTP